MESGDRAIEEIIGNTPQQSLQFSDFKEIRKQQQMTSWTKRI